MPGKIMLLAECKDTLVHPLYLSEHIYRVAIVGAIFWILDLKTTGLVPPRITAHVWSMHQHDPVVRIAIPDLVEMVGPFMAFEYACACSMRKWAI